MLATRNEDPSAAMNTTSVPEATPTTDGPDSEKSTRAGNDGDSDALVVVAGSSGPGDAATTAADATDAVAARAATLLKLKEQRAEQKARERALKATRNRRRNAMAELKAGFPGDAPAARRHLQQLQRDTIAAVHWGLGEEDVTIDDDKAFQKDTAAVPRERKTHLPDGMHVAQAKALLLFLGRMYGASVVPEYDTLHELLSGSDVPLRRSAHRWLLREAQSATMQDSYPAKATMDPAVMKFVYDACDRLVSRVNITFEEQSVNPLQRMLEVTPMRKQRLKRKHEDTADLGESRRLRSNKYAALAPDSIDDADQMEGSDSSGDSTPGGVSESE